MFTWHDLVLFIAFALGIVCVSNFRFDATQSESVQQSTIAWQPYSKAKFESFRTQESRLMILVCGDWTATGSCHWCTVLVDNNIDERIVRQHGFKTLVADVTNGVPNELIWLFDISNNKARIMPTILMWDGKNPRVAVSIPAAAIASGDVMQHVEDFVSDSQKPY